MKINHKYGVRLRHPMCGKAVPFRLAFYFFAEATPQQGRERQSLRISNANETERQSLSAHRAAQPHSFVPGSCVFTEAIKRV